MLPLPRDETRTETMRHQWGELQQKILSTLALSRGPILLHDLFATLHPRYRRVALGHAAPKFHTSRDDDFYRRRQNLSSALRSMENLGLVHRVHQTYGQALVALTDAGRVRAAEQEKAS